MPCIYQVIPFMDRLNDVLEDFAADSNLFPAVRMAAKQDGIILNKYYGMTDKSIFFRIAMSMSITWIW
jgi:hypothetical protein